MSRFISYLNSAKNILEQYKGTEPFASFLKKFFAAHKKYGSKDRKLIGHFCYCYFRLGKSLLDYDIQNRIIAGVYLSEKGNSLLVEELSKIQNQFEVPNVKLRSEPQIADIFPFSSLVSEGIDIYKFSESFLEQPDLFLRIRPGYHKIVAEKLSNISLIINDTVRLPNSTKIDELMMLDREVVVQDFSSQRIGEFFPEIKSSSTLKVWDCCAASGGKSILAVDVLDKIELTVSDIRESIIANLTKRFERAHINRYKKFVHDLAQSPLDAKEKYDLIICDAPCSGSGTWSRTPEQLFYFNESVIKKYSSLQKQIVSNAVKSINNTGYFLYITCSVFKEENEAIVDYVKQNTPLRLVKMEVLKGYDQKADTMFAALFTALPL